MTALKFFTAIFLLPQVLAYAGRIDNPSPVLAAIAPTKIDAGSPGHVLTISGRNFLSSSTVLFNGAERSSTFLSPNRLTIKLTAADVNAPGSVSIAVVNPPPGGGNSTTLHLIVQPASSK
jgi:hypothetical protein